LTTIEGGGVTDVVPSTTGSTDLAMREAEMINAFIETYPALDPNSDMVELMRANIGDVEEGGGISFSDLDRVTVTPGGTPLWMVPDLLLGQTSVKELVGIILQWETSRAFWTSTELSDSPPDCSSRDGITPVPGGLYAADGERAAENPPAPVTKGGVEVIDPATGQPMMRVGCANCPMNQFGSSLKAGSQGKGCKEAKLIYMMRPGEALPTIISVPPTSIRNLRSFLLKAAAKLKKRYDQIEVGLTIQTAKGGPGGNQDYGQIIPRVTRVLEDTEAALSMAAAEDFKTLLQRAPVPALAVASGEGTTTQADS
jgi:hypothetical protein